MKITDPEVIRNGEKDLIEAVKKDLDLNAVKDIIKNRLTGKSFFSRGGQIVVHDNQVAFRLDFDVRLSGSLLFDREGNHISSSEDPEGENLTEPALSPKVDPEMDAWDETDESLASVDLEDPGDGTRPLPEHDSWADPENGEDDDELTIDLPDYGVESEEDLEISDPLSPDGPGEQKPGSGPEKNELENLDLEEEALLQEEGIDEDINDILKESREFWEQKKDA